MKSLDEIFAERDRAPGEQQQTVQETQEQDAGETERQEPIDAGQAATAQDDPTAGPADAGDAGGDNRADGLQNALHAERQKNKRYTEQVAAFEQRFAEQERRMAERDQAWAQRFEQLTAALQPRAEPAKRPSLLEADDIDAELDRRMAERDAAYEQRIERERVNTSLMFANEKYGADVVRAAYASLDNLARQNFGYARTVYKHIMSSEHPYGALVEWDKRQRALAEIGDDPAAYREKIKAELLAEQQASGGNQQRAASPQATIPAQMPSNFATGRNVGARSGPEWGGPPSLEQIFEMRDRKRR